MKSAKRRNRVLAAVAILLGALFAISAIAPALAEPETQTTDEGASNESPGANSEEADPTETEPENPDGEDTGSEGSADEETATEGSDIDNSETEEPVEGSDEIGESEEPLEDEIELEAEQERAEEEGLKKDLKSLSTPLPEMMGTRSVAAGSGVAGLWNDTANRRLGGTDRFETAVKISKDTYPNAEEVNTVIVSTAFDFPDSLSAAPLGAQLKAPLLLTSTKNLPAFTQDEIKRLKPSHIIVIGGTGAVSKGVENSLKKLVTTDGKITRIGGADRYETSLLIAKHGWNKNVRDAFVATGSDFPDALSAGAAAATLDAPVILVQGVGAPLSKQVKNYLQSANISRVHIAGGTGVVSSSIENDLKKLSIVKTVKRYHGQDRFETSAQIAKQVFTGPRNTYWANAFEFPDALTGATAAGAVGAPLLLTTVDCVPNVIYDVNDSFSPADTIVLGGTGALKAQVQHGNECMIKPNNANNANWNGTQKLYAELNKERFINGRSAFRVSDAKVGNPAYSWASNKSLKRNTSLKKQQPWVNVEAVGRASVASSKQVSHIMNLFKNDKKTGIREAIYRDYGGSRPFVSVGYQSGSTGYATVYVGRYP